MTKIIVGAKIDLDVIGSFWYLHRRGVIPNDVDIEIVRGSASEADLANPDVVWIECGGSGQVDRKNFDHHGPGSDGLSSATAQTMFCYDKCKHCIDRNDDNPDECLDCCELSVQNIVDYIDILDTKGPDMIRKRSFGQPPFLSDLISGMLLTTRDPKDQIAKGCGIIQALYKSGENAFGSMQHLLKYSDMKAYADAHQANKAEVEKVIGNTKWGSSNSGKKVAWVESQFFGTLGALYNHGAEIVVAFNPNFKGVRKFTIGGNEIQVNSILDKLNAIEEGWGGPGTGTILGSPMKGSSMTLDQVVQIVLSDL